MDLEEQQIALSEVQQSDFRATALWELVGDQTIAGSVLDVGCGAGGMIAYLAERGYEVRGIDASEPVVAAARRFLKQRGLDPDRIRCSSIAECIGSGLLVDNVISMDCLEHVRDDAEMMDGLVRLVRPGGRLLITVPALPIAYGPRDERLGHFRRYTRSRLLELVDGQPVRVDRIRYWNALGVAPVLISSRLLKRPVYEKFRYGEAGALASVTRSILKSWFRYIENQVSPPIGLTLVLTATRI